MDRKNYSQRSIKSLFQLHAKLFEIFLWKFEHWQMGFSYSNCSRAWNGNIKLRTTCGPTKNHSHSSRAVGHTDVHAMELVAMLVEGMFSRKMFFMGALPLSIGRSVLRWPCLGLHFTLTHSGLTCDMLIIKFPWNNSFGPVRGPTTVAWNGRLSSHIHTFTSTSGYTGSCIRNGILYLHIKRQTHSFIEYICFGLLRAQINIVHAFMHPATPHCAHTCP